MARMTQTVWRHLTRLTRGMRPGAPVRHSWPALLLGGVLLLPPDVERPGAQPTAPTTTTLTLSVSAGASPVPVVQVTLSSAEEGPDEQVFSLHPSREGEGPLSTRALLRAPRGGERART